MRGDVLLGVLFECYAHRYRRHAPLILPLALILRAKSRLKLLPALVRLVSGLRESDLWIWPQTDFIDMRPLRLFPRCNCRCGFRFRAGLVLPHEDPILRSGLGDDQVQVVAVRFAPVGGLCFLALNPLDG